MKVLFIGNSHTYFNDMPAQFAESCEKISGERPDVTMLAYSGRSLEWHMKEYFSERYNLLYGGYRYCVIQQQAHPFPEQEETLAYGKKLTELCRAGRVTPVFYMTWAEKEHPENQQIMIDTYTQLARECGGLLAPVGKIWQKVQREHPEIELYYKDGAHASGYGDVLIAETLSAVILGKRAVPMDFYRDFQVDFDAEDGPKATLDRLTERIPADPQIMKNLTQAVNDGVFGVF